MTNKQLVTIIVILSLCIISINTAYAQLEDIENIEEYFQGIETQITDSVLDVIPQNAFLGFSDFNKGQQYNDSL